MAKTARRPRRTGEAGLDEALADTFPASDPPVQTNPSQSTRVDVESFREMRDRQAPSKRAATERR